MVGEHAVFVRLMDRPTSAEDATAAVESIVDRCPTHPSVNEFKRTKIAR